MIKSKQLFLTLCLGFLANLAFAQLYVDPEGNAGLGIEDSPDARMTILNHTEATGLFLNNTSPNIQFGIDNLVNSAGFQEKFGIRTTVHQPNASSEDAYGQLINMFPEGSGKTYGLFADLLGQGTGSRYGVYAKATSPASASGSLYGLYAKTINEGTGSSFGVFSSTESVNSDKNPIGLYSILPGSTTGIKYGLTSIVSAGEGFAGFFIGDVHIDGNLTYTSDEKLKENIQNLTDALSLVNALSPKTYTFKATEAYGPNPNQKQFGFIAQDIEQVIPEIVQQIEKPAIVQPKNSGESSDELEQIVPTDNLKAVNYTALIAILTQALKEQQVQIDALQARVKILEEN